MTHFTPKSLIFYAVAIGSVVLLFNRVTAYGNRNLQASQNIEGNYLIKAENLPQCLKSDDLALKLQQSGVYLVGSLTNNLRKAAASAEERPTLTGEWRGGQLSLKGPLKNEACPDTQVAIAGSITQKALNGQLKINAEPPVKFTAQRQPEAQTKEGK